jgi:hypothetical protein
MMSVMIRPWLEGGNRKVPGQPARLGSKNEALFPQKKRRNAVLVQALAPGRSNRRYVMSALKTLAIAAALAVGASSFAMAQAGNPASNAAASGGSGTHQSSQKTGSAANNQKVLKNQNGYRGRQ